LSVAPSVWHSRTGQANPPASGADRAALNELDLAGPAQSRASLERHLTALS
jgi:hypothetical protein